MKKKLITWCVANVHAQHTNTHKCALCTGTQTHTLVSKASKSFTGGGNRKPRLLLQLHKRYMRVRNDCTWPSHWGQSSEHTFLFSQIKKPRERGNCPSSSGLRGTYTITIFLQSAWVPVCAFRDIATFVCFVFFKSNIQHTLSDTWERVSAVGTCTCKASVWPAEAKLREEKWQTYASRWAHRCAPEQRLKTPLASWSWIHPPPQPLCHICCSSTRRVLWAMDPALLPISPSPGWGEAVHSLPPSAGH